jgi:hypothetical protein
MPAILGVIGRTGRRATVLREMEQIRTNLGRPVMSRLNPETSGRWRMDVAYRVADEARQMELGVGFASHSRIASQLIRDRVRGTSRTDRVVSADSADARGPPAQFHRLGTGFYSAHQQCVR